MLSVPSLNATIMLSLRKASRGSYIYDIRTSRDRGFSRNVDSGRLCNKDGTDIGEWGLKIGDFLWTSYHIHGE